MLYQHKYRLSPRLSRALLYNQFVNVHGRPGKNIPADLHMEHLNRIAKGAIKGLGAKNIPADLHMEHLNRIAKGAIKGLGANKTEKAIVRIGRALGTVAPVLQNYNEDNDVPSLSGVHKVTEAKKDIAVVTGVLQANNVFEKIPGRRHKSFKKKT